MPHKYETCSICGQEILPGEMAVILPGSGKKVHTSCAGV